MPLYLELLTKLSLPLEVEVITPNVVQSLSCSAIEHLRIHCGNTTLPLAEFFRVSGSADDDQTIVWRGDCARVHGIGSRMSVGSMIIDGHAGMHLGAGMLGGNIRCEGMAGDWLGAEMQDGLIVVQGHAGDSVGSVYQGGRRGMTGGVIVVHGNAGRETGRGLRRGLIGIGGDCGDAAGYAMIAGTIVIFGRSGARAGRMMKRGSLVMLSSANADVLSTPAFRMSGHWRPQFLAMYFRTLRDHGLLLPTDWDRSMFQRIVGDQLEGGQGEFLVRMPVDAA